MKLIEQIASHEIDVGRRRILAASGGALFLAALGRAAATPTIEIPVVDSLTVHVIVDAATTASGERIVKHNLIVEHSVDRPDDERLPRRALVAEYGLSLLAESSRGGETRRILVDFGYTPESFLNNISIMRIDPGTIDAMVLSHGHFDHFGGMRGLLATKQLRPGVPLFVGGEEIFCERVSLMHGQQRQFGAVDRDALLKAGVRIIVQPDPALLARHAFSSGEIPLTTFERSINPTLLRPGVGCKRELLAQDKRDLTLVPDDMRHELATCYVVKNRGLVVTSSCGHRGILNTIERARAISGINHVHAVVGGFHLVWPRDEADAVRTVEALQTIDPDYIVPMHCSGEPFISAAQLRMPGKVIRPYVGSRFIFGATRA
jgi:7,8-dihydropterin-6-yl-methyl-4-(beta-D-ribofuranosyl)aminobenzene 5'-phosphate synthase